MTDKEKLAAIRAEVERLKDSCASPIVICDTLLAFIDSMQEEPTDKEFEAALAEEWKGYNDRGAAKVDSLEDNTQELAFAKGFYRGWHYNKEKSVSEDLEKIVEEIAEPTILNAYGTKELARRLRNTICGTSVSEELEDYINKLSKQFPEVSFAKLSRIAVRVAKWQKQHLWKPADGDDLPEIDREVIVLVKYSTQRNIHDEEYPTYRVGFGHRPNPDGWDGKNIDTNEVTHYTPKLYDRGGWNAPDITYWLDVELPKEIEL